ncbi:site-specific integrase [Paraburkholderia bengalensis]|uniref:Site-specific integrase n=1 Tax=Paraburkholderia bengalensis TaxID=2747562 RepID=A0ABU8J225_9BURK
MHDESSLPDLGFPNIEFGEQETPWNLNVLLYKGGSDSRTDAVQPLIARGGLGWPQLDRLDLVIKLHAEINAGLEGGGSRETANMQFRNLRLFFGFADRTCRPLTRETVTDTYCAWADWLVHRTRMRKSSTVARPRHHDDRPISMRSGYAYGATIGTMLDRALERHTSIVETTRLESPTYRKTAVGVQAEKQNLHDSFAFGHFLQDICDGLPIQTVLDASLPLELPLRSGKTLTCGGHNSSRRASGQELGERYTLVNLRIEAELMMFIAQTGMNFSQAFNLTLRHFFYVSHLDGYQVKDHKARRGGIVLFEIFSDYKPHFERYLDWRRSMVPSSDRLFPFIKLQGSRPEARADVHRLRSACKKLAIPFVSPSSLRNTRVNWLLRKTANPDLTAEMAQHTKQTLLGVYERPSFQRAMVEATRFWSDFDPHAKRMQAVAPGGCTGAPKEATDIPKDAPKPNCVRASGCLWCENHRDVDSLDYVWALASFKHLKVIELSKGRLPERDNDVPPAKHVIDRVDEKLQWFEQSNEIRCEWVAEAEARISEGNFHRQFRDEIAELEGTT